MSVLSKFVAGNLGFELLHTNCYETIHTWNHNCYLALLDALPQAVKFCLKTYGLFYLISAIAKKRDPRRLDYRRILRNTIRSSIFLTSNMVFLLYFICWFRHRLGFFTWPTVSFVAATVASFCAILLENSNRRPMLALYLVNLASETLYRQLVNHGYLRYIRNGEALVFAVGLAINTYFHHHPQEPADSPIICTVYHLNSKEIVNADGLPKKMRSWLTILREGFKKHHACAHSNSCISVSVESGSKNFIYGLAGSFVIALLRSFGKPRQLIANTFNSRNLSLPLFAAALPIFYHAAHCSLNRLLNRKSRITPTLAAAISGLSMILFPSTSIAMYMLWKGFEQIYYKLAEKHKLLKTKFGAILVYAIATGFVLGNVIVEPHSVRKGYLDFLRGLTGGKLDVFNRELFTSFGFDSTRMYGKYAPNLNNYYTTLNPAHYLHTSHHF